MEVKVSVILPVYNVEKYIDDCIRSILHQNLRDIEILCIDDCSEDDTVGKIRNYESKDNRISLMINEKNMGPSYGRNRGLERAKGKYVFFMDSDDYLNSMDALYLLFNKASQVDADLICYDGAELVYESNNVDDLLGRKEYVYQNIPEGVYSQIEYFKEFIKSKTRNYAPWEQMWKRSFLICNSIKFDEDIFCSEDILFTFMGLLNVKTVRHIHNCIYSYRIRNNSLINSSPTVFTLNQHMKCYLKMLEYIKGVSSRNSSDEDIYKQVNFSKYCVYKYTLLLLQSGLAIDAIEKQMETMFERYIFHSIVMGKYPLLKRWVYPEEIRKMKSKKYTVIYGNKQVSKNILLMLGDIQINNCCVALTSPSEIEKKMGIRSISSFYLERNDIVVILAASKKCHIEMINELKRLDIYDYIVLN